MNPPSPTYISALAAIIAAVVAGLAGIWVARQNRKAEERRRIQDREAEEQRRTRDREAEEMRHIREKEAEERRHIRESEMAERLQKATRDSEDQKQVRELAVKLALEEWQRETARWDKNDGKEGLHRRSSPELSGIVHRYFTYVNEMKRG